MPMSAKNDAPGERGRSNGEWAAIVLGLAVGLILGCAVFLRGAATSHTSTNGGSATAVAVPQPATSVERSAHVEIAGGTTPPTVASEPAKESAPAASVESIEEELSSLPDAARSEVAATPDAKAPLSTDEAGIGGPATDRTAADAAKASRARRAPAAVPAPTETRSAEVPVTSQATTAAPAQSSARTAKAVSGPATLAYWNGLNDVIARETAMRSAPSEVTAANAGGFVEARIQAARFASSAIRELDGAAVDPDALALGKELGAWYQEEITNNERAKSLLGSSDMAARKGSAGKSWRASEEQHRRKCDEINRHGGDLRTRLGRKYGLAFPPLN